MHSDRGITIRALIVSAAIGGAAVGCSAPEDRATAPVAVEAADVISCGGTTDRDRRFYVLSAINATLAYYPDLAAAVGFTQASNCEDGHAFMLAYRDYSDAHPDFDRDQPLPDEPDEGPAPDGPGPDIQMEKLGGGSTPGLEPSELNAPGWPSNPVVKLKTPDGDVCTGTFIAKKWILTAAHCLQQINPPLPPLPPISDHDITAAHLRGFAAWTIDFTDSVGGIMTSVRITSRTKDIWQYPHPNYKGSDSDSLDDNHSFGDDIALLHLRGTQRFDYDPLLPGRPDQGAAMRISRLPDTEAAVDPSMDIYGAGFGQSNPPFNQLTSGLLPAVAKLITRGFRLKYSAPPPDQVPFCTGDSGGPAYRVVNVADADSGDSIPRPVLVGSDQGSVSNSGNCTPSNSSEWFSLTQFYLKPFIEERMKRWNGDEFTCRPGRAVGGSDDEFVECWGTPCKDQSDCAEGTEYCSMPGDQLAGPCAQCAACDCVYGQCLPLDTKTH